MRDREVGEQLIFPAKVLIPIDSECRRIGAVPLISTSWRSDEKYDSLRPLQGVVDEEGVDGKNRFSIHVALGDDDGAVSFQRSHSPRVFHAAIWNPFAHQHSGGDIQNAALTTNKRLFSDAVLHRRKIICENSHFYLASPDR